MNLGEAIKELRWELRMTQAQLGEILGLKLTINNHGYKMCSSISHYERGARHPSGKILLKMIALAAEHNIVFKVDVWG